MNTYSQHKPTQPPAQQTTPHVPTQAPSLNIELATHYTDDEKKLWVYVSNTQLANRKRGW